MVGTEAKRETVSSGPQVQRACKAVTGYNKAEAAIFQMSEVRDPG